MSAEVEAGKVVFVGAGPGDPDLMTVRGLRELQAADVILYDALVDSSVLDGCAGERIYVGKRCARHSRSQEEINQLLAERALAGQRVVRLKGGDPGVLGRVGEEALHLAAQGIPFEVVPGVSSATSAPLCAGIPVTHRGLADGYALCTAHRRKDERDFSIPPYSPRVTLLLLMPVQTVRGWSQQLLDMGYPADLPVAFISHGSQARQRVLQTTVAEAAPAAEAAQLGSPTMVVVGRVVSLRDQGLRWMLDREVSEELADAPQPQPAAVGEEA